MPNLTKLIDDLIKEDPTIDIRGYLELLNELKAIHNAR
jgi:hypothetical protein